MLAQPDHTTHYPLNINTLDLSDRLPHKCNLLFKYPDRVLPLFDEAIKEAATQTYETHEDKDSMCVTRVPPFYSSHSSTQCHTHTHPHTHTHTCVHLRFQTLCGKGYSRVHPRLSVCDAAGRGSRTYTLGYRTFQSAQSSHERCSHGPTMLVRTTLHLF
jgi:hypothetical protein